MASVLVASRAAAGLMMVLIGASISANDQRSPGQPRFRSGVEWVQVSVAVHDAHGRHVSGLTQGDFEVFEDDVRQAIVFFSAEPQPLGLGILLDVSASMRGGRHLAAVRAVEALVGSLTWRDECFVYVFNDHTVHIADWWSNKAAVVETLRLTVPSGGTHLYEPLIESTRIAGTGRNRKQALVLITDGNDEANYPVIPYVGMPRLPDRKGPARKAQSALGASETLLYAIGIDWPYMGPSQGQPEAIVKVDEPGLRRLTDLTGGLTVVASKEEDLLSAARLVTDELRHQYTLAYAPKKPPDGQYRRIRVAARGSTLTVRARLGYIAAK